jgi:hypothetical protein
MMMIYKYCIPAADINSSLQLYENGTAKLPSQFKSCIPPFSKVMMSRTPIRASILAFCLTGTDNLILVLEKTKAQNRKQTFIGRSCCSKKIDNPWPLSL